MTMRKRAEYLQGLGGRYICLALERASDHINDIWGEMRDIAEGLMLDLAALAVGTSEEVGVVGLTLVDTLGGGYVHRATSIRHDASLAHFLIIVKYHSWLQIPSHSTPGPRLALPHFRGELQI
jgi:hypothetical protein